MEYLRKNIVEAKQEVVINNNVVNISWGEYYNLIENKTVYRIGLT